MPARDQAAPGLELGRDIRGTNLFREAEDIYRAFRSPGTGRINDAADLTVSPDGRNAIFAGGLSESLQSSPQMRLCSVDMSSGELRVLTFGPGSDRAPQFSRCGNWVAFLSDRDQPGSPQAWLLNPANGQARPTATVPGWVEYLAWSPNSRSLLLGVSGHGADKASRHGGITTQRAREEEASWMPTVDAGYDAARWRQIWLYDLETGGSRRLPLPGVNVWEAVWCGDAAIAAIVSTQPAEGAWYAAHLEHITVEGGERRCLLNPSDQLGTLAADPTGNMVACLEAFCSDRGVVAGALHLIDIASGSSHFADTDGIDISYAEWRSSDRLLLAGHRGLETVTGHFDISTRQFTSLWSSREFSAGGSSAPFARVAGWGDKGDFALIEEGFLRPPAIAVVSEGRSRILHSFGPTDVDLSDGIQAVDALNWTSPDGMSVEGWLARPYAEGPHPTVMAIHGGPVSHYRPKWLGSSSVASLLLLRRGCAVFMPNPRGSSGRGAAFARAVAGDMGGADAADCLAGLDYLVTSGIADPARLGVVGGSYGGFMSTWLITQVDRFAAAVAVAPMTNMVSQHLTSNIPHFSRLFLNDDWLRIDGRYIERSPVMRAQTVSTPCLTICGALDRCTPPTEAIQFHNALCEQGVDSVLVTYPEEGHGIRAMPAAIDYAARVADWFAFYLDLPVTGLAPNDRTQ